MVLTSAQIREELRHLAVIIQLDHEVDALPLCVGGGCVTSEGFTGADGGVAASHTLPYTQETEHGQIMTITWEAPKK